jgi:hypothetical protein
MAFFLVMAGLLILDNLSQYEGGLCEMEQIKPSRQLESLWNFNEELCGNMVTMGYILLKIKENQNRLMAVQSR